MTTENDYYLGNIFHSVERLPQWYQLFAIFGVFFLFSIRDTAVVAWLASSLHNPFGTQMVWSEDYQMLLELMSFDERICFTIYGVALSLAVVVAYKFLCSDVLDAFALECGLNGGRKWWPPALICAGLGCEGMLQIKEVVRRALSHPDSLATLALHGFQGIENTSFDPRLAESNVHFVVQLEVFKNMMIFFLEHSIPTMFIASSYRLLRDVPRRAHAALRWYLVTFMIARSFVTMYSFYRYSEWYRPSSWLQFSLTLALIGSINYIYGPSKRGGWTAATSLWASINQSIHGIVQCTALVFVVFLSVLALVVSVHVVELFLIWLIFFLLTVWIPAIIDSCSTDYIVSITAAICFVTCKMNYLTEWGSARLWALLSLWWLDICLVYNCITNTFRSRYAGILFLGVCSAWIFYVAEVTATRDVSGALERNLVALGAVLEGMKPLPDAKIFGHPTVHTTFASMLQSGFAAGFFCILCITFISLHEPSTVRDQLLQRSIVLITPGILFRKVIKTLVLASCFSIFVVTALVLNNHLLPQLARFAPDFVTFGMALGLACTILGGLMDMQDSLYVGVMRLLGMMDPVTISDEDKEM